VICRNFIAPTRAFTRLANEIIRHPRLSSDAIRLLTWQLSLPPGAAETLEDTAKRANIGGSAFSRAKQQLMAEGYVFQQRLPAEKGRWYTGLVISSVPLRPGEAMKILKAAPPQGKTTTVRVSPQVAPSGRFPAVGGPTTRPTGGPSLQNTEEKEKTPHHPAAPQDVPEDLPEDVREDMSDAPVDDADTSAAQDAVRGDEADGGAEPAAEALERARAVVEAFPALDPDLHGIPRAMRPELTRLTARWLAAGHTPADVRTHVLRSLPSDGTPVRRPGGLLRYLLTEVPPVRGATRTPTTPGEASPGVRPLRVQPLRECEGARHDHPVMFRPARGESLCPGCLASPAEAGGRAEG
jgi:hypothetical protein